MTLRLQIVSVVVSSLVSDHHWYVVFTLFVPRNELFTFIVSKCSYLGLRSNQFVCFLRFEELCATMTYCRVILSDLTPNIVVLPFRMLTICIGKKFAILFFWRFCFTICSYFLGSSIAVINSFLFLWLNNNYELKLLLIINDATMLASILEHVSCLGFTDNHHGWRFWFNAAVYWAQACWTKRKTSCPIWLCPCISKNGWIGNSSRSCKWSWR